jgi:acetyl-CoA carboxylase carboxyltransferase component
MVEQKIESESAALFLSGRLYDDGVIDPRDTRTVLGLCLSIVEPVADGAGAAGAGAGAPNYGVFRM